MYNDKHYQIHHSQYFLLIGIGAVEYMGTDQKEKAILLINVLWNSIMELYLVYPSPLNNDFIRYAAKKIIILKALISGKGADINQIEMLKHNASLITDIINNLLVNNVDITFAHKDKVLKDNILYYIEKDIHDSNQYQKAEKEKHYKDLLECIND